MAEHEDNAKRNGSNEHKNDPELNAQSTLVIIPCYNASEHLQELFGRLQLYVCPTNLLFINDGSTDNTLDLIKQANLTHISFNSNRGKGEALKAGFKYAINNNYRSVLTLDCDLQHLPEEIYKFYPYDDGNTLILGRRDFNNSEIPRHRWMSNNLTSIMLSVFSRLRLRDSQCGFRLVPTALLKQLNFSAGSYDLESEILLKAAMLNIKIREVPISTVYDGAKSHLRSWPTIGRFIRQLWRRIWL